LNVARCRCHRTKTQASWTRIRGQVEGAALGVRPTASDDTQQAARSSDYTALLYSGELIEFDETERIFTHPTVRRTEDYITGRIG